MEWVFIGFTLGALMFALSILRGFKGSSDILKEQLYHLEEEETEIQNKIAEYAEIENKTKEQTEEVRKFIGELENVLKKHSAELESIRNSKEKRGKFKL